VAEPPDDLATLKMRYEPWIPRNLECAEYWKPNPVDWLVVAESPPCPRSDEQWQKPKYMYRIREKRKGGHLLGAVLSGFLDEEFDEALRK